MKQTMPKGRNADPRVTAPATRKPAAKNLDQKLAKQPTKRKKEVTVEKKTPKSADMVTLTKSEFNAILETLGKLSMGSEKIESQATENQRSVERNNRINSEEREQSFSSNANDKFRQQNLPPEIANPVTGIPKAHLTLAEKKRLEWQQQNDSSATGWHNWDDNQRAKTDPRPTRDQRQEAYGNKRMEEQNINNTPLFLTTAEKKKLQWQKERAELSALDTYDPWGRGGCGAPIKDLQGNVVNDYTKRQEVLQSSGNQQWTESASNFKTIDPMAYPSQHPPLQKAQSHPDRMNAIGNGVPSSQGAMMNSFRSGVLAPDGSRVLSEKERQKQEWLEELEKQREEQRQQKLSEKRGRREESPERYYWAERSGVTNRPDEGHRHPPQPAAQEPHGAMRWDDSSTQGQMELAMAEFNRHSAPPLKGQELTTAPTQNAYNGEGNRTFLHGQNKVVDPITKQEQEEKRRKYLEMQEFNRRQVEEREQQRKEEKERRIREELEDERKFNQMKQMTNPTNASMTNPTNASLPKPAMQEAAPMGKEELERRKEELLRQGLELARLEAEREKKQRLIEKLRKGNHDVSHLEAKLTSRSGVNVANTTHRPLQEPSRQFNSGVPTYVEPKYVPGLGDMSSVPNSGPNHLESYRNNYKDGSQANYTQTFRGLEEKASRDFGTQTGDIQEVSRESTEVEYRMPESKSNNNNATKKVRVVSAPKADHKKQRQGGGTNSKTSKQNQGQRPMWGYSNTTNKKPIKQSDRDAHHGTHERQQRRINRQNELLDMMARNADLVPDYRAPTLSRARSRSYESGAEEPKASHENNRSRKTASRHNRSRSQSHSPVRRNQSRSQSRSPVPARNGTNRSSRARSPSLPSIRRHADPSQEVDKYRDRQPVVGASQTNFVPFIRSSNVLNPAHAESPLPMSREPTEMEKARRAYQGVLQPAKYGQRMEAGKVGATGMDPLLNPSLVTEHPTQRQGQILQHLSTLRQALKEKQREMNSISEPMPDQYGGRRIVSPLYD